VPAVTERVEELERVCAVGQEDRLCVGVVVVVRAERSFAVDAPGDLVAPICDDDLHLDGRARRRRWGRLARFTAPDHVRIVAAARARRASALDLGHGAQTRTFGGAGGNGSLKGAVVHAAIAAG